MPVPHLADDAGGDFERSAVGRDAAEHVLFDESRGRFMAANLLVA